jgi:hypothetical protein
MKNARATTSTRRDLLRTSLHWPRGGVLHGGDAARSNDLTESWKTRIRLPFLSQSRSSPSPAAPYPPLTVPSGVTAAIYKKGGRQAGRIPKIRPRLRDWGFLCDRAHPSPLLVKWKNRTKNPSYTTVARCCKNGPLSNGPHGLGIRLLGRGFRFDRSVHLLPDLPPPSPTNRNHLLLALHLSPQLVEYAAP